MLLTLAGMLGLAGGTVLQKRWVGAADMRVSAAVQNATAGIIVVPLAVTFGGHVEMGAQFLLSVAWIAWGMGIVSLLALVSVLRHHAASAVAALLLVVPAVTAIASAIALGDPLHPATLAGMLVAMLGVGAVLRREAVVPQLDHAAGAGHDACEPHRRPGQPALEQGLARA